MGFLTWAQSAWFDLIETLVITGGLGCTAYTIWIDAKARIVSNRLAITKAHREIWSLTLTDPKLQRVRAVDSDLKKAPVSPAEELFVNFLINHLSSNFFAMKKGVLVTAEELELDISTFFSLPIPNAVWKNARPFQDKAFAAFVEAALNNSKEGKLP